MNKLFLKKLIVLVLSSAGLTAVYAETKAYVTSAPAPATTVTVTPAVTPSTVTVSPTVTTSAPTVVTPATVTVTPASTSPAMTTADVALMTAVQQKIAQDNMMAGTNVVVTTHNGWVTLQGTAQTQAQVDAALDLAKSTPGVSNVTSSISVVPVGAAATTATTATPNVISTTVEAPTNTTTTTTTTTLP